MNWSIKTKMIVMGLALVLALGVLAGINFWSARGVSRAQRLTTLRLEQFKLAQDMKYVATELTLTAMDAIVDRDENKISDERMQTIYDATTFLAENAPKIVEAADTQEEKDLAGIVGDNLKILSENVRVNLVGLIEGSGRRLTEIEARFNHLSDLVDSDSKAVRDRLGSLGASFQKRMTETDNERTQLRMVRGMSLLKELELASSRLVLYGMQAMAHRDEGRISDQRLAAIRDSSTRLRESLPSLYAFSKTDEEMAASDQLKKKVELLIRDVEEDLAELIATAAVEEQSIRKSYAEFDDVVDESAGAVVDSLTRFADSIRDELAASETELADTLAASNRLGALVFLVVAVCTAVAFVLFARSLLRPIGRTVRFADAVAEGALDEELRVHGRDELGRLADSLRSMVEQLKQMIATAEGKSREAEEESAKAREATAQAEEARAKAESARREGLLEAAGRLEDVAQAVSAAGEQLARKVNEVSEGARLQSERAAETATSMEEMNATVLEVARNAGDAAENADRTMDKANEGQGVVAQVVEAIGDVDAKAREMKQGIGELGAQAEGIGQVITMITDIADQTNLLALNAAIEAARAGDAGRGFAVVADEVRKLAEKTMQATQQVSQAVTSIQEGTRGNVRRMDDAAEAVGRSTGLAEQAGRALGEIVRFSGQTSDQVRSIATAAEQQSAASEEINHAVEDINRVSDETVSGMGEAEQALANLAEQTEMLQQLIEELRSA